MKNNVIFFDSKPYDTAFFEAANRNLGLDLKFLNNRLNVDTAPLAAGYKAICAFVNDNLSAPVLDILHELGVELVALRCAGYNNVDLDHAQDKLRIVRVPAYSPDGVAEHTVALMLSLNRKTHRAYYRTRDNNFSINGLLGFNMAGKTAGIIGTGKIGQCVIRILRGFNMNVVAYDPYPNEDVARELGFEYVSLMDLYGQSDIISLHCPLAPENVHLINVDTLAQMKDGVMIINTGRGGLIDTPALLESLKNRKVGSAGLDVYEEETDYFFEDFSAEIVDDDVLARLLTFPNVLVTAHQAFFTREALDNIAATTLGSIQAYFKHTPLPNEICHRCGC